MKFPISHKCAFRLYLVEVKPKYEHIRSQLTKHVVW